MKKSHNIFVIVFSISMVAILTTIFIYGMNRRNYYLNLENNEANEEEFIEEEEESSEDDIISLLLEKYNTSKDKNLNEKSESNIKRIKWACLGDSITDKSTLGVSEKVYGDYIQETSNYDFINLGYGGSGIIAGELDNKNYLRRVNQVPRDTQVVTIFGSLNDPFSGSLKVGKLDDRKTDTLYGNLNLLLDELYKINKYMIIGIITPTQWGIINEHTTKEAAGYAKKYVDALIEFANYNSIPYLDLYSESGIRVWDEEITEHFSDSSKIHPDSFIQKIYYAPKIKTFLNYLGNGIIYEKNNSNIEDDFDYSVFNDNSNYFLKTLDKDNYKNVKIYDEVVFGKNEWIVADIKGDEIYLISRNIIDCAPFNTDRDLITWKDASLRTYLNNNLYNDLFRDDDKQYVKEKEYVHMDKVSFATSSNAAHDSIVVTQDKLTIPCYNDIKNLLLSDSQRRAKGTARAYKKGLCVDQNGYGYYWLRDNGSFYISAMTVKNTGDTQITGYYIDVSTYGVRPSVTVSFNQ